MRMLYVTTIGGTMVFFTSIIKSLIEEGHTVDIATNENGSPIPNCYREWGCTVYQIDASRSPFNKGNLKAIKQIKELVTENQYDIVHCHTPIAAMCTRLACRKARKKGTKVFYTAHGFHFYNGAPLKNWLIYYPVEKICAHWTDTLITINKEDYALAKKKIKAKRVEYVPGVGIDLKKFSDKNADREEKRKELGIPADATLLLSVGELNDNKNHEIVIRAIADLNVYYIIAGDGDKLAYLEDLIHQLGLDERVQLLGFRKDVPLLLKTVDVYVLPSKREGLNVSVMEAMASGLPCAISKIRGNVDLIDENGGVLFDPNCLEDCKQAIQHALQSDLISMGEYNSTKIKNFEINHVNNTMRNLYFSHD